jgi:uncharacterized membrane protein (UPF0182 family)
MKFKLSDIRNWTTERVSQRVLYVVIAFTVIVFGLFYTIGYDRPFDDDPSFNAPLFTDLLLAFMFVLTFIAAGVSVWAVVRSLSKMRQAGNGIENNVPVARISRWVLLSTLGIAVFSFLIASSDTMLINGKPYSDWLWLKISDVFIYTSVILLLAAVGAVIYGATRYIRKGKR